MMNMVKNIAKKLLLILFSSLFALAICEVGLRLLGQAQEAFRAKYKVESLEYVDDRVERQARANGIPTLRLAKPLLDEARRTGSYMTGFANSPPNEFHLNERGRAVVAREMVRAICEIAGAQGT